MRDSTRRLRAGMLTSLGVGVALVMGPGLLPAAAADEIDHGGDQVTITVTISAFDRCAFDAAGCTPGGDLAATGLAIGLPLGAGILLAGVGAAVFAVTRKRRTSLIE